MVTNLPKHITIVGDLRSRKLNGGQTNSIPELTNLLLKGYSVNRIFTDTNLFKHFNLANFNKFLCSKYIIFNSDFYPIYIFLIPLTRFFSKKCIFIPRGAYNVPRIKINITKLIYILFFHYFFSGTYIFLSKSEKKECSNFILKSPKKNFLIIPPTFKYLQELTPLKILDTSKNNTSLVFAGRPPEIYNSKIRDPKGFFNLLSLFPVVNAYGLEVKIFTEIKQLDQKLLKFDNFRLIKPYKYKKFVKELALADFLFQISHEGEGFSQLIMQALTLRVKLLVNRRSLPEELINIVEQNLNTKIPKEFYFSESKSNLNIFKEHLSGKMDNIHNKLFDAALIYLEINQEEIYKSWQNLLNG